MSLKSLKSLSSNLATISFDDNHHENSAGHSWQVALTANVLAKYASVSLDIAKVTKMLLIHDIVEMYSAKIL